MKSKSLTKKVARGELTEEQAKQIHRAKLEPEERERLEKIDVAEAKIAEAQKAFEVYSGMTEVQAVQDSQVMLDGVAQLSSHNNVIEDAIEGVNLTLKGKSELGKPRLRLALSMIARVYGQILKTSFPRTTRSIKPLKHLPVSTRRQARKDR